jgi:hypothetical protein
MSTESPCGSHLGAMVPCKALTLREARMVPKPCDVGGDNTGGPLLSLH